RVFRVAKGAQDLVVRWLPDGNRVVVQSDSSGAQRAGILDLAAGEPRWLGDGRHSETAQELSPSGRQLLVDRNIDASHQLVAYDLERGSERVVALPHGAVGEAPRAH